MAEKEEPIVDNDTGKLKVKAKQEKQRKRKIAKLEKKIKKLGSETIKISNFGVFKVLNKKCIVSYLLKTK